VPSWDRHQYRRARGGGEVDTGRGIDLDKHRDDSASSRFLGSVGLDASIGPIQMHQFQGVDSLLPPEMAARAEEIGVKKAGADALTLFGLAVLAGAFIALGAIFSTTVGVSGATINTPQGAQAFSTALPYGIVRLLSGLAFSLGLILVVVGGAELFTGNNLIVMAWASRKVTTRALLRNWGIVYAGNFAGAV